MPHLQRLHRDQRDAAAMGDGLQLRGVVAGRVRDDRAFPFGMRRALQKQRDAGVAHRRDAARVQNAAARGRDLLSFPVVQASDQPGRRHCLRIRAEEARHVRPVLETPRLEHGREVGGRRVRAAAPEQHGLPSRVAGNEPLRDHEALDGRETRFEIGARAEIAAGRQELGALALLPDKRAHEQLARIVPYRRQADATQVRRAESRRRELPDREHARVHARAHLPHEPHAGDELLEPVEELVQQPGADLERARERRVLRPDPRELGVEGFPPLGRLERSMRAFETPASAECTTTGLTPSSSRARIKAAIRAPVLGRRHAAPAELHDDPGRVRKGRLHGVVHAERAMKFHAHGVRPCRSRRRARPSSRGERTSPAAPDRLSREAASRRAAADRAPRRGRPA